MLKRMALIAGMSFLLAGGAQAGSVTVGKDAVFVDFRSTMGPQAVLGIEIVKTKRVPEDGKVHGLPPHDGALPLFLGRNAHPRLVPQEWRDRDTVIAPVAHTQALWINFIDPNEFGGPNGAHASYPFAIVMAAGKVNVFDGKPLSETLYANRATEEQNYVVTGSFYRPGHQRWVDGYKVRKGVVRQFVAVDRASGLSVEEYLTGKVQWGGVQFLVFPLKKEVWERVRHLYEAPKATPRAARSGEKDLAAGGEIKQVIEYPAFQPSDFDLTQGVRFWLTMVDHDAWPMLVGKVAPPPVLTKQGSSPFAGAPKIDEVKPKKF